MLCRCIGMAISEFVADFVYGVNELEDVFDFFFTPI